MCREASKQLEKAAHAAGFGLGACARLDGASENIVQDSVDDRAVMGSCGIDKILLRAILLQVRTQAGIGARSQMMLGR